MSKFNSITAKEAAESKQGMEYLSTKVKRKFLQDGKFEEALTNALKIYAFILKKGAKEPRDLTSKDIKILDAVGRIIIKFIDKTFATMVESRTENVERNVIYFGNIEPVGSPDNPDGSEED